MRRERSEEGEEGGGTDRKAIVHRKSRQYYSTDRNSYKLTQEANIHTLTQHVDIGVHVYKYVGAHLNLNINFHFLTMAYIRVYIA